MNAIPPDNHIRAQLQEHQELVHLYIHEDSLAWQLNIAFLTINIAIFTGLYTLGALDPSRALGPGPFILLVAAIVSSLAGFFVFQRNKLYLTSRLQRCYEIEDQLAEVGIPIRTLSTAERTIEQGAVIRATGTRRLRWWERVEVLQYRYSTALVVVFWIACSVWLALGRPGL